MTDKKSEKIHWMINGTPGKTYNRTAWYRSPGIQEFVEKVEEDNKIVGVIFSGNKIGFVIGDKYENKK